MYLWGDKMLTAKLVKEKASGCGFDLAGITTAEPLTELAEVLKARQHRGEKTVFVTPDLKQRTEPKAYFAKAKAILMVGLNYYSVPAPEKFGYGKFARYAWGEDYHLVFKEKLQKLAAELKQVEPLLEYKLFVDTGPLIERELAKKAGLGFIGKNGSLINPKFGSWILLGGMVLNWELEADLPMKDNCGNCDLCIKACPSGAIKKPYQIDTSLCLSYLTQKKDCLGVDECQQLQNRVFGCDTCQDVCPINRRIAKETLEKRLLARDHLFLTPEVILKLNKKELEHYFSKTAALWVGSNRIKRNFLIVLVNNKKTEALPYLISSLGEPSPLLRRQAALLLSVYREKAALSALEDALHKEREPDVYLQIQLSLQQMTGRR